MQLDDDDLVDYDDYDESLDEVLAVFRNSKPRISEDEALAALEHTDYDVDAAIAELKRQQASKQAKLAQKSAPKPKPAASQKTEGKLSKLQLLAQKRQGDGKKDNSSEGALARLVQRHNKSNNADTAGGIIDRFRRQKQHVATHGVNADSIDEHSELSNKEADGFTDAPQSVKSEPEIDYSWSKVVLCEPSTLGLLMGGNFAIGCTNANTAVPAGPKAKEAFSKPSPDEQVLSAQSEAFEPAKESKTKNVAKTPATASVPKTKTKPKDGVIAQLNSLSLKPNISFVVIGHVDAGKSTLMGRLLLDAGAIPSKLVDKYEKESSKIGKGSFALAWLLDATEEERERGVTVDFGEASFETPKARFSVVDAPGHRDYVPNMIAGVSQAEVAVLVVDAATNAFESGFSLDGQTKEHAVLARGLGIDQMIVAINKLDIQDWSQDRFEDIKAQLEPFLQKNVGFNNVTYVPTSGKTGVNIVKPSSNAIPWYNGPTLVQSLESVKISPRNIEGPFRFLVSNAFPEAYRSTIQCFGRVLSGIAEKNDPLVVNDTQCVVKSVESGGYAVAGSHASLEIGSSVEIRPGDVITAPDGKLNAMKKFESRLILFDIPRPLLVGTKLSFYMGRHNQMARVSKILAGLDKHGNALPKVPRHIIKGQAAKVELELEEPTILTTPSICKELGRFVLRLNGKTVGGGVVEGA